MALSLIHIFVLLLMSDLPMKIRHEQPVPPPGKDINQMKTDRASVDSELALLAFDGYERQSWLANPYFNKREDFVGSGLPTFLVCRMDGLTAATCMRLVTEDVYKRQTLEGSIFQVREPTRSEGLVRGMGWRLGGSSGIIRSCMPLSSFGW